MNKCPKCNSEKVQTDWSQAVVGDLMFEGYTKLVCLDCDLRFTKVLNFDTKETTFLIP